ncbi:MAG: LysM peptidoglycan-binding domain-containing protein, partial [Thermoanaerobaculia bacterium]
AYLKDLYRQFNDWSLALAAYNAGPNRIRRAMAATGATTFWELLEQTAVPRETRGYVPTFFATLMIASDPSAYGFRLGDPVSVETARVEIEGPVSLHYIAEAGQIDEAVLRELNPSLRQSLVPPGRTSIRIPARASDSLTARGNTLRNDDASMALCSFTLREGDSLKRIASVVGASVETLLAMNGRKSDDLRDGDSVYLPVRARELGALLSQSVDFYSVKKGDTLFSIAKRHGLSVPELLDLNDFSPKHPLHPGDRVRTSSARALAAGGL